MSELHRRPFFLMGIPGDQSLRHTLRVYEFDGHQSTKVTVRIRAVAFFSNEESILASTSVILTLPSRVQGNTYDLPGYAQLGNLRELFPELVRWPPLFHIEIISEDADRRLWAMLTITNATTGQVTVVTPDQERN